MAAPRPTTSSRFSCSVPFLRVLLALATHRATLQKLVVPDALRALRLAPGHRWCKLGDVQARVGWTYAPVVQKLEVARKTAAFAWHVKRKVARVQHSKAVAAANNDAKVKPFSALLQATGYNK